MMHLTSHKTDDDAFLLSGHSKSFFSNFTLDFTLEFLHQISSSLNMQGGKIDPLTEKATFKKFSFIRVNKKRYIFAKSIKTIFSDFIRHENFVMTEIHPGSVTKLIKVINKTNTAQQSCIQNGKNKKSFQFFQVFQNMLFSVTAVFKQQYYSRISKKLMDSSSSPKIYRSLLSKTSEQ